MPPTPGSRPLVSVWFAEQTDRCFSSVRRGISDNVNLYTFFRFESYSPPVASSRKNLSCVSRPPQSKQFIMSITMQMKYYFTEQYFKYLSKIIKLSGCIMKIQSRASKSKLVLACSFIFIKYQYFFTEKKKTV